MQSIQEQFNSGVIKKELTPELIQQAQSMLDRVLPLIEDLNPSQITFAVTWDKSLYFRLKKNQFDIHAEFFFTEVENDGIELVLGVYDDKKILLKQAGEVLDKLGMISDIWKLLLKTINND